MTTRVAPWLEGLSEAWEVPPKPKTQTTVSSASHDADSLRSSRSRLPRPSLTGLPSSLSRQNTNSSQASTQKRRNPLAPLSSNDNNSLRRQNGSTKLAGTRSFSEASDGSMLAAGTVQLRSKSASPSKKQQTLEWKRRLVQGEVGYGDHTDLFGPSGLENIFARSKGPENEAPRAENRMGWLQKSDAPMPSSPPPWPSSFEEQSESLHQGVLQAVEEEGQIESDGEDSIDGQDSFRSNPFDLESATEARSHLGRSFDVSSPQQSSPEKAFIEPTQDEVANSRTISGQTELEQEDFSPVYVSKHKTVSGQVNYAAVDSHLIKQFQDMKVDLRHPSQEQLQRSSSGSFDHNYSEAHQADFTDGPQSDSLPAEPDISFSENLPTGSPFPNLGGNVQLKRGGYSQIGSFKRRPLSTCLSGDENSINPDASGLLSPLPPPGQRPPAPTPPNVPTTPIQEHEPSPRSSGSPLKLFAAHDTFTSNRLLRRMSQLNPDGTIKVKSGEEAQSAHAHRIASDGSSFGNGELDGHAFDAEITITSASNSDRDGSDGSPGSEIPAPGSKMPFGFHFDEPPDTKDTFKMKRKLSKHTPATSKASTLESQKPAYAALQPTVEDVPESQSRPVTSDRQYADGKRPPTSPFKNPTPKRRRTLHASELMSAISTMNEEYHSQLQEATSTRKRKDARNGEAQNTAGPDVLAQRKILRPRNPTPSQRRREQIEAELREAANAFAEQEPERLEAVMEQIESSMASEDVPTLQQQAHTLASEVAAFTLKVRKPSGDQGERKRSVTTQDFLNEAMMVMNLIRAKARPQSNLGSVEESDAEAFRQSLHDAEVSQQADSLLRVSRPPSREGSGWRNPAAAPLDVRVISHLRKFEEKEEVDDTNFIANSIASLQVDNEEHINEQVVVVDEQSHVRITGPLAHHERGAADSDSRPASQRSHGSTLNTQSSAGTSTGRTIGTGSTRKSDNVGTLAPDAVAHLIGEQVGGMTFDKDKQRWIRQSKSPEKAQGSFLELPSTVTSDDDPFREISDLPVDEQNELRRISMEDRRANTNATDAQPLFPAEAIERTDQQPISESRTTSQETVVPRPITRDSSHAQPNYSSSVPSKYTAFASSQQYEKVETRATSWSDEELAKMSAIGKVRQQPLLYAAAQAAKAQRTDAGSPPEVPCEAAHSATIHSPSPQDVATADHAVDTEATVEDTPNDAYSGLRENTALGLEESVVEEISSPKLRQTPFKTTYPVSSSHQASTRQISLRRKTLTNKFSMEAHEQSELSIVAPLPGDRVMSLSLSVSRPVGNRHQSRHVTELQSSPSKGNSSFILSDLPDFTIHEEDEERPSERALATRLAQHAAAEVEDRYALAVKGLVKILTDVNGDEPYWEDLKELDLHDRALGSLYGLSDFCTGIQDMDVANNALQNLQGAPSTVRRLDARLNQLSSLTSWNHLVNLQYLDISNNHLENLDGLSNLIHVRELRADDNGISNVTGIFGLDGLLTLRLRRNKLQRIDFEGCYLHRLEELDLCENQIVAIEGLEKLSALNQLKLDHNDLPQGLRPEQEMPQLTLLSMRSCNAGHLDVSWCPDLKHLNVDDNRLRSIGSIHMLKGLQMLSLRRQALSKESIVSVFDQPLDASAIHLSGNSIPRLQLCHSFLNLRHLELASTGLQELPDDFGLRMPNLRTLNLNFNSLQDIRPLLNIHHLEQLTVCGNRLQRLRKSVATLERMTTLRVLDVRDNPLTQGFYVSLASTLSKQTSLVRRVRDQLPDDEGEQVVALEKLRYELPCGDDIEDRQHRARLDEDAALRRRVYEVLIANSCRTLVELDGLAFERSKAVRRDGVWDRLVQLGIIRKSQDHGVELSE